MAKERKGGRKPRRERKTVPHAVTTIHATFNNTIITVTDHQGNTVCWSSPGAVGLKGSRRSTAFAARLENDRATEFAEACHQVERIAFHRLKGALPR